MLHSKNLEIINSGDLCYVAFPNIKGEAVAAFTTRMGGVSTGKFASMNMSFSNGDSAENVKTNFDILFNKLGLSPKKAVFSAQTHTDNLMVVTEKDAGKGITKPRDYSDIDGLLTNVKGVALVTQFADCVPLLFYDPVKKAVAASHAGWRGTVAQIGAKTVKKMAEVFGSCPEDIKVAIGPSIGKCCYEVDDPVIERIKELEYIDLKDVVFSKGGGKYQLDLWELNRLILLNAGIKNENICVTDLCTCCHSEYFHSHRATNANRGNLAAVIALK